MNKVCLESDLDFVDHSAHVYSSGLSTTKPISVPRRRVTPPPVHEVSSWIDWTGVPEGRRGSELNIPPPILPPLAGAPLPHSAGPLPRRGDTSHSVPELARYHNHPAAYSPRDCLYDDDGLEEEEHLDEPGPSGDNCIGRGPVRLPSWSREEDYETDEEAEEEEEEEERKGQEEEETGKREKDGSKRKQAEDKRQGFQDWDSSGSYSQQRNSFLSLFFPQVV